MPAVIAAILAAEIGRRTFYPRPPIYTYLFLVLLYALLHEVRAGRLRKRWLAATLPFFCLWANVHGGWAAGGVKRALATGRGAKHDVKLKSTLRNHCKT